jgi:serine/threonine-protein kinase RsbW
MAGTEEWVRLVFPPHAKFVSIARLAVAGVAARTELTVDDIDDLKVAVSEACTNAIDHAFEGRAAEAVVPIEVTIYPAPGELRVEVVDEGSGFDPKRVPRPDGELHDKQGGLGLYLIERLMDRVEVQSAPGSGTRVVMTKRASR